MASMFTRGLSVGLGQCEPCRSPGAHYYPPAIPELWGIWLCDSCSHPDTVRDRIHAERAQFSHEPFVVDSAPYVGRDDGIRP